MNINDTRNLVLVGSSGAGKSKQAKAVAAISGRSVFDVDAEIVKSIGMEIPAIFADKMLGEAYFRGLETEFLAKAALQTGSIIVPGAGAVCKEENRIIMRVSGVVLWIDVSLPILQKQLAKKKDRPLALTPEAIAQRFWERRPLYADVADLRVVIDVDVPSSEVTERILRKLGWK